ncbi:MAG: phosphoribosylamine--glycine ligase, partial [Deltaproteobacteria bacterium]|nr:phosphoribosylamine--glycine ligase [Deltaproteobacteria bacterium]
MNVLIVGGGGREHALSWKLSKSKDVEKIYIAPGNPGTAEVGENVDIKADDIDGLLKFAKENDIALTIVGPELPLTLGIVDIFEAAGLKAFGPSKKAAQLEGSKAFSKELMAKCNIPTAAYKKFTDADEASEYVNALDDKTLVIKADGLAAGKGVIICEGKKEAFEAIELILTDKEFGEAGSSIVIEEFLLGEEASFLAITDGVTVIPLAPAQDHKPIFDDDKGPNTGGMGAYSPAPVLTKELQEHVMDTVMIPAVKGMADDGIPYKGILYAGLMITDDGPKVLEFNCRFGDPEAQPLLLRLTSDLGELLLKAVNGQLSDVTLEWDPRPAVCVVLSSKGYP